MSVIHSVSKGGGGFCLSACWDTTPKGPGRPPPRTRQTPPQDQADPPEQTPPWDKADPPGTRQTPLGQGRPPEPGRPPLGPGRPPQDQTDPPGTRQIPPRSRLHKYGLRAAGTHPTGMHSCVKCFWRYDHVSNRLTDSLMRIQREKKTSTLTRHLRISGTDICCLQ